MNYCEMSIQTKNIIIYTIQEQLFQKFGIGIALIY